MTETRKESFLIITLHYIIAAVLGWASWRLCKGAMHPYLALFVADAVATIYIWALGLVYRNVSFYDPYWSVAPPVMLTAWAVHMGHLGLAGALVLVAVWYWGIRLTWNWAVTFKGLQHEDWRYTKYRTECRPWLFHVINFFGLNMVPTIVVFLAMLPAFELLFRTPMGGLSKISMLGFAVSVCAATIQLIADRQSHRFRREHPGEVCNVGLWKHGRHPNYFGEISMWWGVWLTALPVVGLHANAWMVVGPISVTILFCTVSIPLMEHRQLANKPAYAEYRRHTRLFI